MTCHGSSKLRIGPRGCKALFDYSPGSVIIAAHYYLMAIPLPLPDTMHIRNFMVFTPAWLRRLLHFSLVGIFMLGAGGCVYQVPIQQGNFLESKDIDQVMVGMTQAQVRYVLGTPMVVDPFTKDRWDYLYYLKIGQMRTPEQRHFVVYFANGAVTRIERSDKPKA
jgi:outer membrane protein assembly factor BamE